MSGESRDHRAIVRRINRAYRGWVPRLYVFIRFIIIHIDILSRIEEHLPKAGRIVDIGCGFGLFSMFFKLKRPERAIEGFDLNRRRIDEATAAAAKLGLENIRFTAGDATRMSLGEVDGIVILDLLHHVSPAKKWHLLEDCHGKLRPGGVLVVKDVTTAPLWKYIFNYAMDILMVGREPVYYLHHQDFEIMLRRIGFDVSVHLLNDWLPYPHVLLVCRKGEPPANPERPAARQ